MTMDEIYTHATGASGNQIITVDVRDDDTLGSQRLDLRSPTLARPANCFVGMLIGPAATISTLSNTNHIVTGPAGSSEEQEAEVYYRIDDDQASENTSVTAE